MNYNISELAKLAGITTRTLRYYDQIGLLSPKREDSNDYRTYDTADVDLLQQIMVYRELDIPLEEIKRLVLSKGYDGITVLQNHLTTLKEKKTRIESLIYNVEKTISTSKGGSTMSDKEKFEGFKRKMIDENEKKYGKEIREKYGNDTIDASNAKMMGMTPDQYEKVQELSGQLNETLKAAFEQGDPAGELAQKTCALHKEWLCYYWTEYSKEAHAGLAQMYVDDARFKKYYDDIIDGGAVFLRDALLIYCKE